jgi:hypothetical protein
MSKIAYLCLFAWVAGIGNNSCMAMENFNDGSPDEHLCPIRLEAFILSKPPKSL